MKSFASCKQLEGVNRYLAHAIWMIISTSLSSTFTIGEMRPPCIRDTITLLDRVTLLLIVLRLILEDSIPYLEVI